MPESRFIELQLNQGADNSSTIEAFTSLRLLKNLIELSIKATRCCRVKGPWEFRLVFYLLQTIIKAMAWEIKPWLVPAFVTHLIPIGDFDI